MTKLEIRTLDDGRTLIATLDDGRALTLTQMTFGNVRLCISSSVDSPFYDDGW